MHAELRPSMPLAVLCCRCCFARFVLPAATSTRRAQLRLQVLFQRWLAVLQQAGKRLPFKAENWETVTGGGQGGGRTGLSFSDGSMSAFALLDAHRLVLCSSGKQ